MANDEPIRIKASTALPKDSRFNWLNSFRNRIALVFGLLLLVLSVILATYAYQASSTRLTNASGQSLAITSQAVANILANTLEEREREIILLSQRRFFTTDHDPKQIQVALDRIKDSYEHYAWIGYADIDGQVVVAGDGMLQGADVSQRPWFIEGQKGPFVGDVHEALLLANMLQRSPDGGLIRFVDFAAPVKDDQGVVKGVIATHSNWAWVNGVLNTALPQSIEQGQIEIFIIDKNHAVLYPDAKMGMTLSTDELPKDQPYRYSKWQDGQRYLVSMSEVTAPISTQLNWKIVVRQPSEQAMMSVYEMRTVILLLSAFATIIAVYLAYQFAGALSRPIEQLAVTARSIQNGNRDINFSADNQLDEVASLSQSLQSMMTALLQREQSLVQMNTTLESKIQDRTKALEQLNEELANLALHDPLTQCFNRLALEEAMSQSFQSARQYHQPLSVIMLDIDHFKKVNDEHGHKAGDSALKQLVKILQNGSREQDCTARYGGEEFTLVLPNTNHETACKRAESLRAAVEQADFEAVGRITISLGVATLNDADTTPETILNRADEALYRSKANGRNCVSGSDD